MRMRRMRLEQLKDRDESETVETVITNNCAQMVVQSPLLTFEEEKALAKSIIKGRCNKQSSREKFFNANLRLVFKCTSKYSKTYNIPYDDLFGEACVGLMNAVDKFNPFKYKTRFSTYAYTWIKKHLNMAVMASNSRVYVPQNIGLKKRQYDKIMEGDNKPTRSNLKKELCLSEKGLRLIEGYKAKVFSLDQPAYSGDYSREEQGVGLVDKIEDTSLVRPDAVAISNDTMVALQKVMKTKLDPQEQIVIRSRYFEDDKQKLQDLAKMIGVTKQRINQIEITALEKMKRSVRKLGLK